MPSPKELAIFLITLIASVVIVAVYPAPFLWMVHRSGWVVVFLLFVAFSFGYFVDKNK